MNLLLSKYLLEQQQMRWQLNTKIKALSDKENNLLRNEKWGVCQNINKFVSGVDGCKGSDDVAKCESCLTTVNDALNSAADLLSFIDNKRKNLYTEEHTPKPFAGDELKYFQEAQERVKAIYEDLQRASNKLTTTHEPEEDVSISHGEQSPIAKKKRKQKKGEKENKEKRLHQRAYMLLGKLTSKEVTEEIFDSLEKNNNFTSVSSINAEFTGRFVRRLYLDPLLWLMEKGVFDTDLARNMEVVVASMNEGNGNGDGKGSSSGDDSDESDEEAVQEPVERAAEESAKEAL